MQRTAKRRRGGAEGASAVEAMYVQCPVCFASLPAKHTGFVNDHLDQCLGAAPGQGASVAADPATEAIDLTLDSPRGTEPADAEAHSSPTPEIPPAAEQPTPEPVEPAQPPTATSMDTNSDDSVLLRVVGRKFQAAAAQRALAAGTAVHLAREPDNVRDPNAILVMLSADASPPAALATSTSHTERGPSRRDPAPASPASPTRPSSIPLGHVSARTAAALAPLLDGPASVRIHATLEEDAPAGGSSLCVRLRRQTTGDRLPHDAHPLAAWQQQQWAAVADAEGSASASRVMQAENFDALLATVRERDSALLSATETSTLSAFATLSAPAKLLYVRLLQRRGPWFSLAALQASRYPEVVDMHATANELQRAGLVRFSDRLRLHPVADASPPDGEEGKDYAEDDIAAALKTLLQVLTMQQLHQVAAGAGMTGRAWSHLQRLKRDALLAAVAAGAGPGARDAAQQQQGQGTLTTLWPVSAATAAAQAHAHTQSHAAVLKAFHAVSGVCIRLTASSVRTVNRAQLLFFMTPECDLTTFLSTHLGLATYPPYRVWRTRPVFADRAAFVAYEAMRRQADAVDAALEVDDKATAWELVQPHLSHLDGLVARAAAEAEAGCVPFSADDVSVERACTACRHRRSLETSTSSPHATHHDEGSEGSACDEAAARGGPPPSFFGRFRAEYWEARIHTRAVDLLEQRRRYWEAVLLLRSLLCRPAVYPSKRGHWWFRLSVDLEHLKNKEGSVRAAEAGVEDVLVRKWGDHCALKRRVARLSKPPLRWARPAYADAIMQDPPSVSIEGRPLNYQMGRKSQFVGLDDEVCSVEHLALQHYAAESNGGWRGTHCEGGGVTTLFVLLFWDVVFAAVPDVFQHPFQPGPLDLFTPEFGVARQPLVAARLADIERGNGPALLRSTWNAHHGQVCRGVSWDLLELAELEQIARCLGGAALAAICRMFVSGGVTSGGLPDLLLWRPMANSDDDAAEDTTMERESETSGQRREQAALTAGTKTAAAGREPRGAERTSRTGGRDAARAMLVEVKGPRDSLSYTQRAWMTALDMAGVRVELLKVFEPAVKTQTARDGRRAT